MEVKFGVMVGLIVATFIALWNFWLEKRFIRWLGRREKKHEPHSVFIDPRKEDY